MADVVNVPLRVLGGGTARLVEGPDGEVTLRPDDEPPSTDLCVSPGWIDLHAHVYDGMTTLGVPPDSGGLDVGVHVVADAGSAGAATLAGLARYVVPASEVAIRAWVNIGSYGLVHLRETADIRDIDVDATLEAIDAHRDLVCGVKVRSSGEIVGAMGLQPLQLGRLVAREAGLPLMVHIGEAPPLIEDVLDLLGDGDVITHCYHGKVGTPWLPDGRPKPALARALARGLRLDVGHGVASFSYKVAERAVGAGYPPHSISTDLHVRNIGGPVHDLPATVTKLIACGMDAADAIAAVTTGPSRVLRREPQGATIFRLADTPPPGRTYLDAHGVQREPTRHVVPVATLAGGRLRHS